VTGHKKEPATEAGENADQKKWGLDPKGRQNPVAEGGHLQKGTKKKNEHGGGENKEIGEPRDSNLNGCKKVKNKGDNAGNMVKQSLA